MRLTVRLMKALDRPVEVDGRFDPRPLHVILQDDSILYGRSCTWWGACNETHGIRQGCLLCPHCITPLLKMDADLWYTKLDKHAQRTNDLDYQIFMDWLKGHSCWNDPGYARRIWNAERQNERITATHTSST